MNLKRWCLWGAACFGLFLAILYGNRAGFLSNFIVYTFLFIIAGEGWNLLGGYIGEISFGHAVFFGVGAYCVGLPIGYGYEPPLAILVVLGGVVSALLAWILSFPLLRMRGFPFLIATFGLGVIFQKVFHISKALFSTRGIFLPSVNTYLLYAVIGALAIASVIFAKWLVSQNMGLSFRAIRDAPDAARMAGVNIFRTKMTAFVIGAFMTGIAGALFALYRSYVQPVTCFSMNISLTILLGPYIGGIGTVMGAAIGAFVVLGLEEISRDLFVHGHHLFLGVILIVIMLTMREGIWPTVLRQLKKIPWSGERKSSPSKGTE